MSALTQFPDDFLLAQHSDFDLDLFSWLNTVKYSSSAAALEHAPGAPLLLSPANDNVVGHINDNYPTAKTQAGKPSIMFGEMSFLEATTTGQASWFFGRTNGGDYNEVQDDNTGELRDGFEGYGIYAKDGHTNLFVAAWGSGAGNGKEIELSADNRNNLAGVDYLASSASTRKLKIEVRDRSASKQDVNFWIDGVPVATITIDPASAGNLYRVFSVKNGSATNQQARLLYWGTAQKR